jgi:hypothetical protein
MAYNTIKLKKYSDVIEEMTAAEAITPGHLVEINTSGNVIKHNSAGAPVVPIMFAIEDELEGGSIDDAYASADKVQVWIPGRGDQVYAIVADDAPAIVIGDALESAGDGTVRKQAEGSEGEAEYANSIVGEALEAIDVSGSSGDESSGPLGYDKRIRIRIV